MYSREAMLRSIAPHLAIASVIIAVGATLYGAGDVPAWTAYLALTLAMLVAGVGVVRWEERHHR